MTTTHRQVTAQLEQLYEAGIVDAAAVAYVAGASTRSVARWRAGHAAPRKQTARRLRELGEVIDLARRVLPGSTARSWLRATRTLEAARWDESRAVFAVAPTLLVCRTRLRSPGKAQPTFLPTVHPLFLALELAQDRARGREILDQWTPDHPEIHRVW